MPQTQSTLCWKTSRYTRLIEVGDDNGLLYNGYSGALLLFSGHGLGKVHKLLERAPPGIVWPASPPPDQAALFRNLVAGGFVVDERIDELALLEDEYERERNRSRFCFMILSTFNCNLDCDYCFVGKKNGIMSQATQDALIDFVARQMQSCNPPSMAVDWFGGEPLLAHRTIAYLSRGFLDLCASRGIPYSGQIITNGTLLTVESPAFLKSCGIDSLQVTLDGSPAVHDLRRHYKIGKKGSFDTICAGLKHVVGKLTIRLRVNVDQTNIQDVLPLLDLFAEHDWLGPDTRFFPYLAPVRGYTQACAWVEGVMANPTSFHEVNFQWLKRLSALGIPVGMLGLYHFPDRRLYNCGAVGPNGFVVTPGGELHKCGMTLDDSSEAVGMVGQPLETDHPKLAKWRNYSPFDEAGCRECEFLPSCLGGCPRDRMLKKEVEVAANCMHHKRFENQIISRHLELLQPEPGKSTEKKGALPSASPPR